MLKSLAEAWPGVALTSAALYVYQRTAPVSDVERLVVQRWLAHPGTSTSGYSVAQPESKGRDAGVREGPPVR